MPALAEELLLSAEIRKFLSDGVSLGMNQNGIRMVCTADPSGFSVSVSGAGSGDGYAPSALKVFPGAQENEDEMSASDRAGADDMRETRTAEKSKDLFGKGKVKPGPEAARNHDPEKAAVNTGAVAGFSFRELPMIRQKDIMI